MRGYLLLTILIILLPVLLAGVVCVLYFFNAVTEVSDHVQTSPMLLDPPPPLAAPVELKVVTFNIQDLPLVSSHRRERMRAIAAKLLVLDPDIVGFQEAFVKKDRELLIGELRHSRLHYHQYYRSGLFGSGLLISSAYPIEEAYFTQFKDSGPWYRIWEGDFWAGKGVALARIALPEGHLDFFNTHTQAGYGNPAYRLVRRNQMTQMAEFINRARVGNFPALVAGDINCRIDTDEYNALVNGANLVRLMTIVTRIDHIFGCADARYVMKNPDTREIKETVSVNQKEFELSDHNGYISTIQITPAEEVSP